MALMSNNPFLYRLLRDDENPFFNGIVAKYHFAKVDPITHVRYGSQRNHTSQWISTSREISAVDKFIRLKRQNEGANRRCRVCVINEQMLKSLDLQILNEWKIRMAAQLFPVRMRPHFIHVSLSKWTTGQILDFTDQAVMDKYIPVDYSDQTQNGIARSYAMKYKEVLIERFIPAECCVAVYER